MPEHAEFYYDFLDCMKSFKINQITTEEVWMWAQSHFQTMPDLIEEFKMFMPPDFDFQGGMSIETDKENEIDGKDETDKDDEADGKK